MSMRNPAGFISAFYDPLKTPDAPTIGTATAGDAVLSVTFTAPANVGGSAITSYIATARKTSDGTLTSVSGASSPIVVTSLTNASAYTATVAAVNSYGQSAASAASNSVTPVALPSVIGEAYGGGYYAGQIGVSSTATHYIIVGPVASAENSSKQWKTANTTTAGTTSVIDGPTNSANMNNASHPAAQFCEGLTIGGFSDWYLPAKNELEVCYYNLKPTTTSNANSGTNTNAVPSRGSNYTSGTPAQTSATDFRDTGAEDFTTSIYWSSTEATSTYALRQTFLNGGQYSGSKTYTSRVRAIRRIAV
jgi:hypothetical protein